MSNLVDRYVHQVGLWLPDDERAEIEAELRSMIEDRLIDQFEETPSDEQIADILMEMGSPHEMAASYNISNERYLVGPELYPYLMVVLRYGWAIIPSIVIFLNIFSKLVAGDAFHVVDYIVNPLLSAIQVTATFSAIAVFFFAVAEYTEFDPKDEMEPFKALELPEIDDPTQINQFEISTGIAAATLLAMIYIHFLRVGGLTLGLNPSDSSEIIEVPEIWTILFIGSALAQVLIQLTAIVRNRWNEGLLQLQVMLELLGAFCLYFVAWRPLYDRFLANTAFAEFPFADSTPEIFAIVLTVLMLISEGGDLVKLKRYEAATQNIPSSSN